LRKKKYTSPLVYDGENFDCAELNSIKSNCTPLNTVLKLFADKICELLNITQGVLGNVFHERLETLTSGISKVGITAYGPSYTILKDGDYIIDADFGIQFIELGQLAHTLMINGTALSSPYTVVTSDLNLPAATSEFQSGSKKRKLTLSAGDTVSCGFQDGFGGGNSINLTYIEMFINKVSN